MGEHLLVSLKRIYHKYSQSCIMRMVNSIYMNGTVFGQWRADCDLKKMSRQMAYDKKPNQKIVVVFLCQNTKIWSKLEAVYEAMRRNERLEPYILVIPEESGKAPEDNLTYFYNRYQDRVLDCRDGEQGKMISLRALHPQYVFYQRPYDQYLPEEYRSAAVCKYAKTCYIDYGYEFSKSTKEISFEKKFFRNIYLFFAENRGIAAFNSERMKRSHNGGYRKSVYCGYPAFENFHNVKKRLDENISQTSNVQKTVIWTPRWSEDRSMGGSNFFTFKDQMIAYFSKLQDTRFIFRPHPLTFSHFVSIGRMTDKDVEEYLANYQTENMIYDADPDYAEKFWASDVLVTDFSSVLVEYLLTGKPVIYCDLGAEFDDGSKSLLDAMYIAKSWEDVKEYLDMLLAGEDPLQDKRKQIVREQFGDSFDTISDCICKMIEDDFVGR